MKKSLAALTLSLYGCTVPVDDKFGGSRNKESVVNGYEGASEDFPAIGAFIHHGGTLAICTVSLLKKDLALTAAHCISPDGSNPNGLGIFDPNYVLHGRNEIFNGYCEKEDPCSTHMYRVAAAVQHPMYDNSSDTENHHDIALLLLEQEILDAEPIELLPKKQFETALEVGDTVTIAAYCGHYEDFGEFSYGKLYAADVPVTGYHNQAEIIVGENGFTNGCYGDSGGPMYVYSHGKVQLTGVASRISEQTDGAWQCGYGIIYGLPTLEKEWIESEYDRLRKKYPLIVPVDENVNPSSEGAVSASCQFSSTSSGSGFLPLLLVGDLLRRRRK